MQDMRAHRQVGDAGCGVCWAGGGGEGGQRGNFQAEACVEGTANVTVQVRVSASVNFQKMSVMQIFLQIS